MKTKRNISRHYLNTSLIIAAISFSQTAFSNETLRICDDVAEYPPYVMRDAENFRTATGATYDLFEVLFERANINYEVELLPWKRCLVSVEKFQSDKGYEAFANASYSEERAKTYHVSDSLFTISNAYWFDSNRYESNPMQSLDELADYKFCSMRGYNTDWLSEINPDISFVEMDSYNAGFRMLAGKRCDLLIGAIPVIRGLEQMNGQTYMASAKPVIFPETLANSYHLYVSRNSPRGEEIIEKFNAALSELKAENKLEEIYRRYLPECGTDC